MLSYLDDGAQTVHETLVQSVLHHPNKRKSLHHEYELYQSMKKLKTGNDATKRFLLALHYMNQNSRREITFHGSTGNITFGEYF